MLFIKNFFSSPLSAKCLKGESKTAQKILALAISPIFQDSCIMQHVLNNFNGFIIPSCLLDDRVNQIEENLKEARVHVSKCMSSSLLGGVDEEEERDGRGISINLRRLSLFIRNNPHFNAVAFECTSSYICTGGVFRTFLSFTFIHHTYWWAPET